MQNKKIINGIFRFNTINSGFIDVKILKREWYDGKIVYVGTIIDASINKEVIGGWFQCTEYQLRNIAERRG